MGKTIMRWIIATMAILGLAITSSDGQYFPILNLFGLLILCIAILIAWATEQSSTTKEATRP